MERRKTMWIPAIAAVAWTGLTIVPATAADTEKAQKKSKQQSTRDREAPARDAGKASTSPGTTADDSHGYGSGNVVGTEQAEKTDPSRSQGKPQAPQPKPAS
jgi:hypothetical protein